MVPLIPMESIYRRPEGEARILDLYDRGVAALGPEVDERWVETRFGSTHVLEIGPRDARPLVILHGGNALNPLSLAWFEPLARSFRIHAPDLVGHPGKSAQARPDPEGDAYGRWVVEVLDGLGLDRAPMAGPSYGAGIILRAAAVAPERIERAALVVPAGIVEPRRVSVMARLALPTIAYRLSDSRKRLRSVAETLFTEPPEGLWLEALAATLEEVEVERRMPKTVERVELAGYAGPTLVFGAEDDVLFPGRNVVERAATAIPGRVEAELLEGERHVPSSPTLARINARILAFLSPGEARRELDRSSERA
ncbi:MAG: alpha/beta fold hydrolase [Gemmatimonadota bacterium]|nr:alpha/beta fold hydrolase [Gemmatimonadota bacterium]